MPFADLGDIGLHYREDGDPTGAPIVFANALGSDFRIWDGVVARLPASLRILRYDMRGHGLSDCPPAPYTMGALVRDAERLIDARGIRDAVFVGLSIGGMVAQGLAVKRLDQIRALVLSNTGAKLGTAATWDDRIAAVRRGGIEAIADGVLDKWFPKTGEGAKTLPLWRNMLTRQPAEGYMGCSAAIAGTDFYTTTAGLTLPTLAIAGSDDGSTPADLVRETADLIKGARFKVVRRAGHLPCIDAPDAYADLLTGFLKDIGHL